MLGKAPVGRGASARKYDLLSAMMAFAFAEGTREQVLVMRLMSLITTRYNWQRDELAIGQREIARLWCVDERTVKREMAKLRARGWLIVKRQGARGRVSVHGLDLSRILRDTAPAWPHIGPDYVARMGEGETAPVPETNVVPLHPVPEVSGAGVLWPQVQACLRERHPAQYTTWLSKLEEEEVAEGCLSLVAPSAFVAASVTRDFQTILLAAAQTVDPGIARVIVRKP